MRTWASAPVVEVEEDPVDYPGETTHQPKGVDAGDVRWTAWYPGRSQYGSQRCLIYVDGDPVEVDKVLAEDKVSELSEVLTESLLRSLTPTEDSVSEVEAKTGIGARS